MDISQFDLEYLRPPPEAAFLNHDAEYIKSGSGKTAKRKIFYNTPFDTSELKAVHDLESLLQKQGFSLPPQWNKSESLKYLYSAKFDMNVSAKMIRSCLQWRSDSRSYMVTPPVKQYYDAGIIYPWGVDYHFRPIMIVNLNKLKTAQVEEDSLDAALTIMMDVLRSYCFIPRKIENWVIIVDVQNVKNLEPAKIKPIIYLIKSCFPSSLEKLFIISSPSSFETHWDTIQEAAGGDLPEEIHLLSNTDLFKLQTFIPPDSLEKKYGGVCPDVEKYWPPPARHVTKRGSVTGISEYSDPNNSNFLNESFRSDAYNKFTADESAIPNANYNSAPTGQNPIPQSQPKIQNQQRHTVSAGVPNDLGGSHGSRNEFERRSQNDFPSLPQVPSTGAIKEEEFIRNLIYAKSPSRSTANQMKPESQTNLQSQYQPMNIGSHNSLQGNNSLQGRNSPAQRKSAQSGVPYVQSVHVDDDVMSVRSMSSTSSKRNQNANIPGLYEKSLVDQVNNPSRTRITEPEVPIMHENIQSFHGDPQRNSSRNSLSGNYVEPERAKRTVNAGVPQEYQSLNNSTRSPFVEGGNYRDTMESPPRKTAELNAQRGDMEERATKKGPQEFRKQLIENSANNSDDEDDGERFCGLCIKSRSKKKQSVTNNNKYGKNVYEY